MKNFLSKMEITKLDDFSKKILLSITLMCLSAFISSNFYLKIALLLIALLQVFIMNQIDIVIKRRKNDEKIKRMLAKKKMVYNECLDILSTIESLLKDKYEDTNEVIKRFKDDLNNCKNYNDYLSMRAELNDYLMRIIFQFKKEKHYKEKSFNSNSNNIKKYFNILGLSDSVKDFKIIKKAYLRKVKEYHPDNNENYELSLEKTKELNIAYNNLKAYYLK